jgi:hypothetical protein
VAPGQHLPGIFQAFSRPWRSDRVNSAAAHGGLVP